MRLQYLDDWGAWRHLSRSSNELVRMESERVLSRDPSATPLDVTVSDGSYSYDLGTLCQTNQRSGFRRALRLFSDGSDIPAWVWKDGSEWRVSWHATRAIDGWRSAGFLDRMRRDVPVYILGRRHEIDLDDCLTSGTLRDVSSGVEWQIQRARESVRDVSDGTPPRPWDDAGEEGADDDVSSDEDEDDDDVPHDLRCPITTRLMRHPVQAADGTVYEESAIRKWFSRRVVSPLTNAPLDSDELTLHIPTLTAVARYRASRRAARSAEE